MRAVTLDKTTKTNILRLQTNELTEYHIYLKLAQTLKHAKNRATLKKIAAAELRHYQFWLGHTRQEKKPDRLKILKYYWLARIFGITFALKLLEKGEARAQINYTALAKVIPAARRIVKDEEEHEQELIAVLDEEKLNYIGSIVLGLNDALVELTGTLAGLTFALQKTNLIAVVGLITGIAASLSMAASEYLSIRSEGKGENALKSAIYTGLTYVVTVILLILPYFLLTHYILCLSITLLVAIGIIFLFNYYLAVVKDYNFRQRFLEMALLSMGVATLSFIIGFAVRLTFGVDT
jgi:VIT1/CCC1 family predicted Fe2+/Mn2+ transporter